MDDVISKLVYPQPWTGENELSLVLDKTYCFVK